MSAIFQDTVKLWNTRHGSMPSVQGRVAVSEKRYQVFISSTFSDLQQERAVLTQALPVFGCLPRGMEINPAGPNAWAAIRGLIDEADYYILLLGSRYGKLSPSGISYVHMEYVNATTKRKPMLVLMHEAPEKRSLACQEGTPDGRRQFNDFRNTVLKGPGLIAYWRDERDLELVIRQHLPQLIEKYPAAGWVRASASYSSPVQGREVELLKEKLKELEQEREQWLSKRLVNPTQLASGQDLFTLSYRCKVYAAGNCTDLNIETNLTWNDIFASFAPYLSQPQHEDYIAARIVERLQEQALKDAQLKQPKAHAVTDIVLAPATFNTIKIQFRTLGLIRRAPRDDVRTWWQLTVNGELHLNTLLNVRRTAVLRPN